MGELRDITKGDFQFEIAGGGAASSDEPEPEKGKGKRGGKTPRGGGGRGARGGRGRKWWADVVTNDSRLPPLSSLAAFCSFSSLFLLYLRGWRRTEGCKWGDYPSRLPSTLSSSLFLVLPKWEGGERLVNSLFKKPIQKHTLPIPSGSWLWRTVPSGLAKLTCSRNQFGGSRCLRFSCCFSCLAFTARWSTAARGGFRRLVWYQPLCAWSCRSNLSITWVSHCARWTSPNTIYASLDDWLLIHQLEISRKVSGFPHMIAITKEERDKRENRFS